MYIMIVKKKIKIPHSVEFTLNEVNVLHSDDSIGSWGCFKNIFSNRLGFDKLSLKFGC